jgi:hypothetical protein
MKKQSKIRRLPTEDQKRIVELCAQHTYDEVAAIVAKPRAEGGLDFKTNRSALSRFSLEHGSITLTSNLTCQFLDILEQQPTDFDELLPHMTNLIGKAAFLLIAQHRPFEEYRRPLETFMRLEKLCREREKILDQREQDRRSQAQLRADLRALETTAPQPASNPNLTTPAPHSGPAAPPVPPITLDYSLPSFQNARKPVAHSPHQPNITKRPQDDAFKLPGKDIPFSHLSLQNPGNLTNLTKSHVTILPSEALPCP